MLQKSSLPVYILHSIPVPIMETHNNTTLYHHHHHHRNPSSSAQEQQQAVANEHMFEKPLTPSDVGKLNRLVIPKQHAEKYFPLAAGQQKGSVLSFEDESGKLWRFRYSYWISSQSYVFTKGWSRYVREKRLDAGDIVLFQRHTTDCDRMFIRWRRRYLDVMAAAPVVAQPVRRGSQASSEVVYDGQSSYDSDHHLNLALPLTYQPDCHHAVETDENVHTYQRGEVATRRLRLFGVNLECQDNSEPLDPHGSIHGGQSDHRYNFSSNNILHHSTMRNLEH